MKSNTIRRIENSAQFWQQEEATLESMFLKTNCHYLDLHEKNEIISYLPDLKEKRILDLAAGIGRYTRYFSSQAQHLVSVDIAPQFIHKNRQDHTDCSNVSFLTSNVLDLDFKNGYFDFIFINWLFMYLEDSQIETLFERIDRWMALEGSIFIRESCDLKRSRSKKEEYYCHYRPASFYEQLIQKKLKIEKEGYIRVYVDTFADPFQCFWLAAKN